MSTATLPIPSLPVQRPAPVASVFLPKEHGSWSLALEPLALGLLVAPSWAGGALAGAVLAGFFARRPLKAALDTTPSVRRQAARRALALLVGLAGVGQVQSLVLAPWTAFWPLLPAAALAAVFMRFDAQGDSRAAASEVAGSAAFAFVPAAFVTLAGGNAQTALALAILALARSVPAVLAVRSYLRMAKGGAPRRGLPLLVAAVAWGVSLGLVLSGHAPFAAGWLGAILFARVAWLLGPWRPLWPAKRIGMMEAALGLIYIALMVMSWPSNA
ncbi:MAG: hypothetical protein QG602_1425 [Verrucomicrobiota bacterium]|nr:hypothetical protein [Verrucomicrobiota bacterium]